MIDQIVIPTTNDFVVHVPDDYINTPLRIKIEKEFSVQQLSKEAQEIAALRDAAKADTFDATTRKFNRDKANSNYRMPTEQDLTEMLQWASFDGSGWRFNREEANDYD